jgi:hypothetical protein
MFHDYGNTGVRRVVEECVIPDKEWLLSLVHGWSAVVIKTTLLQAGTEWFLQPGSNVGNYSNDE